MAFTMTFVSSALFHLLVFSTAVCARPPSPIGYFPNPPHPWSADSNSKSDDYILFYKQRFGDIGDSPLSKGKSTPKFPVYSKAEDGFVPSDLKTLNDVYWWKKRYYNLGRFSPVDVPYFGDNERSMIDEFNTGTGGVKKRDYTAAQLVNMLKALAKARRQRQIRITGKSLRFGISK